MAAPRVPRKTYYMQPLTSCQASETGCAGHCETGGKCPDEMPMTSSDLVCAAIYVGTLAVLVCGVWAWRVLG